MSRIPYNVSKQFLETHIFNYSWYNVAFTIASFLFQCQNPSGPKLLCKPGILHVIETLQWLFNVITLAALGLLENLNEMNFGRCGKMITFANGTAWFSKGSSAYQDLQSLKQKKKNANTTTVLEFFLASVLPHLPYICGKLKYIHAASIFLSQNLPNSM